jgi:hypothetical protein
MRVEVGGGKGAWHARHCCVLYTAVHVLQMAEGVCGEVGAGGGWGEGEVCVCVGGGGAQDRAGNWQNPMRDLREVPMDCVMPAAPPLQQRDLT